MTSQHFWLHPERSGLNESKKRRLTSSCLSSKSHVVTLKSVPNNLERQIYPGALDCVNFSHLCRIIVFFSFFILHVCSFASRVLAPLPEVGRVFGLLTHTHTHASGGQTLFLEFFQVAAAAARPPPPPLHPSTPRPRR